MPYNFVVSVHILYNYFVVVMKTFIVTRSNETNASLWSFMGGGHLLLCLELEARHGTGVSGHFMGSYMNY